MPVLKIKGLSVAFGGIQALLSVDLAIESGEIHGLDDAAKIQDLFVFHAGTGQNDERFVTSGGRVLGVTGRGTTVADAIKKAYEGVAVISWKGVHFRSDIGKKAIGR